MIICTKVDMADLKFWLKVQRAKDSLTRLSFAHCTIKEVDANHLGLDFLLRVPFQASNRASIKKLLQPPN